MSREQFCCIIMQNENVVLTCVTSTCKLLTRVSDTSSCARLTYVVYIYARSYENMSKHFGFKIVIFLYFLKTIFDDFTKCY